MKYENYDQVKSICKKIEDCNNILSTYEDFGRKKLIIDCGNKTVFAKYLYDGDQFSQLAEKSVNLFLEGIREYIKELNLELESL